MAFQLSQVHWRLERADLSEVQCAASLDTGEVSVKLFAGNCCHTRKTSPQRSQWQLRHLLYDHTTNDRLNGRG